MLSYSSRAHQMHVYFATSIGIIFAGTLAGWLQDSLEWKRFFILLATTIAVPFAMKSLILVKRKWSRSSHPHRIGLYLAIIIWLLLGSYVFGTQFLNPMMASILLAMGAFAATVYTMPLLNHCWRHYRHVKERRIERRSKITIG